MATADALAARARELGFPGIAETVLTLSASLPFTEDFEGDLATINGAVARLRRAEALRSDPPSVA